MLVADEVHRSEVVGSTPTTQSRFYCGEPIKWHFHEEYAGWRSIDPETGEEHECDPSSMLKTMTAVLIYLEST